MKIDLRGAAPTRRSTHAGEARPKTARPRRISRVIALVATVTAVATLATACGSGSGSTKPSHATQLRLGYFANVTHATPVVGVAKGFFQQKLGSTKLTTQIFNAGPAEMEALLDGSIDAAYVGPSPAINAFVQSHGEALKIIAGATSGGAELVVKPGITSISQLRGTTLASPQLGNTQDVALRYFLKQHGFKTSVEGGGDVKIEPTDNSTTLTLFKEGKIDGAWLPEPWASRLVVEAGAKVLVDERTLWPNGQFATTNLAVSTSYLKAHPQAVDELLAGQIATNQWIDANASAAQQVVNSQLAKLTGKALQPSEIARAWTEQQVTNDPLASTVTAEQSHAVSVGLLKQASLKGIFDLAPLNQELKQAKLPTVSADGFGQQ
jgi:NitT/TauT family transport system substrate-binding protein